MAVIVDEKNKIASEAEQISQELGVFKLTEYTTQQLRVAQANATHTKSFFAENDEVLLEVTFKDDSILTFYLYGNK